MIKIMIVDDMPVDREYLRNFIDWNAYGFEACCEAKDGKEALELYELHQPDIVLTDIKMPYMDGIQLSEKLLAINPDLSIILITGNSEFEYARKALKLGVRDYIVKPFEKEELIITLLKLQDNISALLESENEKDQLMNERKVQLLRNAIYASATLEQQLVQQAELFLHPFFLVITIRANLYENTISPEEIMNWKEILSSLLEDMIEIHGEWHIFQDYEGNIVCILNFATEDAMKEYESYEFEDVINLAKEHIGFQVLVGISDYCFAEKDLKRAYLESIQALAGAYQETSTRIFDFKKMKNFQIREFYSYDLLEEINHCLDGFLVDKLKQIMNQELDRIKEYENPEFSSMIYMSLFSVLFSYLAKKGRSMEAVFGQDFHPLSLLNAVGSYQEKRGIILDAYDLAMQYQLEHMDSKWAQIAKQAKTYVDETYSNPDLTIDMISRSLFVNQTYLRRMFKDEFQMTISDYITKCRMEKAKEMILTENSKLAYISTKVGYNDTSYFSKCFKKYFGYLPSDIINRQ